LWTKLQLELSKYELGTQMTDHFEVVEKTPTSIAIRCGDSPQKQEGRPADGLFVVTAEVDKAAGEVELGLKSCFFNSAERLEPTVIPMPRWMEELHRWYARQLMVSASRRLLA
jgi:hypothetical protein